MRIRKRKCRHCKRVFVPDRYNYYHQRYCGREECRKASKRASRCRWSSKPENAGYFRGESNVERVRRWRLVHPGYWRKHIRGVGQKAGIALQELAFPQLADYQRLSGKKLLVALQELVFLHQLVFEGLASYLTGVTLQEGIAPFLESLYNNGKRLHGLWPCPTA